MWRDLATGLAARLVSYIFFGIGFWCLFKGFMESNYFIIAGGVVCVPVGMYLMVKARRKAFNDLRASMRDEERADN